MLTERIDRRDVTFLLLKGSFEANRDLDHFAKEMEALLEEGRTRVILDLHLLAYLNSTAVGRLVKFKKRFTEKGGDLLLLQPTKSVKEVLELLHLDQLFKTYAKDTEALAALGATLPGGAGTVPAPAGPSTSLKTTDLGSVGMENQGATILFKLGDADKAHLLGKAQGIGDIQEIDPERLTFHWRPPEVKPGTRRRKGYQLAEPELYAIFALGSRLVIKFRLPLYRKAHYFEIKAAIEKTEILDGGLGGARVHCRFIELEEEDRRDIVQFLKDLTYVGRQAIQSHDTAVGEATPPPLPGPGS